MWRRGWKHRKEKRQRHGCTGVTVEKEERLMVFCTGIAAGKEQRPVGGGLPFTTKGGCGPI